MTGILDEADGIARQLIEQAQPLRFGIALTASERESCYRLRYIAVMERGWARPEEFPEGIERDEHDDAAVHVCGWDGDEPIATSRAVLPQPGRPLPIETAFGLEIEPRGRVVYVSRLVVARSHSSPRHHVFGALLARTWLALRELGFSEACGTATPGMLRLYHRAGLETETLGPAGPYWGALRYPVRLDLSGSLNALSKQLESQP